MQPSLSSEFERARAINIELERVWPKGLRPPPHWIVRAAHRYGRVFTPEEIRGLDRHVRLITPSDKGVWYAGAWVADVWVILVVRWRFHRWRVLTALEPDIFQRKPWLLKPMRKYPQGC